jgi:glutathione S-transferase
MKLMGSSFSPFVRKVLVYAQERGIELELEQMGLRTGSGDFERASPFRKMPGFVDGDFAIADSTAIITYLNAKLPDDALFPTDPASRARVVWFEEYADTMLAPGVFAMFGNRIVKPKFVGIPGDLAEADRFEAEDFPALVDYLEGVVPASGYLVDDRFTLADIVVATMFVNYAHAGVVIDPARWPKVTAYIAGIHQRPSFAGWIGKEQRSLAKLAA